MDFLIRERYNEYVKDNSAPGSGTAHSYVAALDMLGPILQHRAIEFSQYSNLWSVNDVAVIKRIYNFVLKEQNKKEKGIFGGHEPSSYWDGGYYSAALGRYIKFLRGYKYVEQHEDRLWKIYKDPKLSLKNMTSRLDNIRLKEAQKLVSGKNIDFSSREGKEKLKLAKVRVNQGFFRKMILSEYHCQCCITGLSIPEVLRASHIVGWAEDTKNRMNPANGLCLSATYDAAFDRHLVSLDENYRLILSPSLKEHYTNKAFKEQFLKFEGHKIQMPERFCPDQGLLGKHRGRMAS